MKRLLLSFAAGCTLFALTGCTQRLIDFTFISTKNVDLSKAGTFQRAKQRVEGEDLVHIIIFIPTGVPNMKEAVDRAIEKVPGGIALVDGVLSSYGWWFLYGQQAYIIEGTPLVDPALAAASPAGGHIVCTLDGDGEVAEFAYVTQEEYGRVRAAYGIE
ncbi:MAG TPA: hypothetical protein DCM87_10300 [Planctomycetes bacterium]|nr:hypothetical protein [Planctomycetota bacterium]